MAFFWSLALSVPLVVLGCSHTSPGGTAGVGGVISGAGGVGGIISGFGGTLGGLECPCTPVPDGFGAFTVSLHCFCLRHICDPESGEYEGQQLIVEEYPDCDREVLTYETGEGPETSLVIDTGTGELVGGSYVDDSGVCTDGGTSVSAGEFPTCELSRTCDGPCEGMGGAGGEAGQGGGGGEAGQGGGGGEAGAGGVGGGAAGAGGMGGEGGAGGADFISSNELTDAALVYELERCQCQRPAAPISASACLALAIPLPYSDRQNECIDAVVVGEERMTLENRFACLIGADLEAADCLAEVNDCSEGAISDCLGARQMGRIHCPTVYEDVIPVVLSCQATVTEDGVDAFLDSRTARCDCITSCTSAEPDPQVMECMVETLQAEVDALGPNGPHELRCITRSWRQIAVCFGNEMSCDGLGTACDDLTPPDPACEINRTVLDDCLAL